MKRILSIILISATLFLFGCKGNVNTAQSGAVNFYYLQSSIVYNAEDGVVGSETYSAADATPEELISQYFLGPTSQNLNSPFPENLKLISITQKDNEVVITVSKEMTSLSGLQLTLACSCLAKTMQSILPAERYVISSADGKLDGRTSIVITPETYLFVDSLPVLKGD